jgi:hypothetical protein
MHGKRAPGPGGTKRRAGLSRTAPKPAMTTTLKPIPRDGGLGGLGGRVSHSTTPRATASVAPVAPGPSLQPHLARQMEHLSHLLAAPPPPPGAAAADRLAELKMQADLFSDELGAKAEELCLTLRGLEFLRRAQAFAQRVAAAVDTAEDTWRRRAEESEVVEGAKALARIAREVCKSGNPVWRPRGAAPPSGSVAEDGSSTQIMTATSVASAAAGSTAAKSGPAAGAHSSPRSSPAARPYDASYVSGDALLGGRQGATKRQPRVQQQQQQQQQQQHSNNNTRQRQRAYVQSKQHLDRPGVRRRAGADRNGTRLPPLDHQQEQREQQRELRRQESAGVGGTAKANADGGQRQGRPGQYNDDDGSGGVNGGDGSDERAGTDDRAASASASTPAASASASASAAAAAAAPAAAAAAAPKRPPATFLDLQAAWTRLESLGARVGPRVSSPGPRAALERVAKTCDACVREILATFDARLDRADKAIGTPHELPRVPGMLDALGTAERGARWVLRRAGATGQLERIGTRLQALRTKCDDAQLRALGE